MGIEKMLLAIKNIVITLQQRVIIYARMIKFSHTIFALPFALSAVVMASRDHDVALSDFVWILLAMVGARSAAMGFNRITDADIDAKNPRTLIREIPAGLLSRKDAAFFVVGSSALFLLAAAMLGKLCFFLSFPVLFFLMFYSVTKRFTKYCHLYLGFAISLAPVGAWIAITDSLSLSVMSLTLALLTYIAGFDILYACQDIDFDREHGLFSMPAKLGAVKSMIVSSLLHLLTFIFFVIMYFTFGMHPLFLPFLIAIGILLVAEHHIVRHDNLEKIDIAFFNINSLISVLLFAGVVVDAVAR